MASGPGSVAYRFFNGEDDGEGQGRGLVGLEAELLKTKTAYYRQQLELSKSLEEESNARTLLLGIEVELKSLELEQAKKERDTVVAEFSDGTKVTMLDLLAQERIARAESAIRRSGVDERRGYDARRQGRPTQNRPQHVRGGNNVPRKDGFKNTIRGKEALEAVKAEVVDQKPQ